MKGFQAIQMKDWTLGVYMVLPDMITLSIFGAHLHKVLESMRTVLLTVFICALLKFNIVSW